MKKAVYASIILLIFLVGTHCKSSKQTSSTQKTLKAIYIDQFKLVYFRKILLKSYNNSDAIKEIIANDHSGFTEPLLTDDDYSLIDSLTTIDNLKMIADSSNGNYRAEGSQGKRPLVFILEKQNSKWLDSLAKIRFKRSKYMQALYNTK